MKPGQLTHDEIMELSSRTVIIRMFQKGKIVMNLEPLEANENIIQILAYGTCEVYRSYFHAYAASFKNGTETQTYLVKVI